MNDAKYIFAVMDDYNTMEKMTTDWKLAFEYASKKNYRVDIWCDGAYGYMMKIFCYNTIEQCEIALNHIKLIKNECLRIQIEKYLNDRINGLNN